MVMQSSVFSMVSPEVVILSLGLCGAVLMLVQAQRIERVRIVVAFLLFAVFIGCRLLAAPVHQDDEFPVQNPCITMGIEPGSWPWFWLGCDLYPDPPPSN